MPSLSRSNSAAPRSRFPQALDRAAIALMILLGVLIGVLLWGGDRTSAQVRQFSWQDKQVGADDTAFILSFNRPMDHDSVKQNLKVQPDLPGKISWAGRRMAYTLTMPAPYGTQFQVQLQNAKDLFAGGGSRTVIKPFAAKFQTRDRAFTYIGTQGDEEGRLVLYNLTTDQKLILSPSELVVMDYKFYPLGDRILFTAAPRTNQPQGLLEQQLYTVTTGIHVTPPQPIDSEQATTTVAVTQPPGQVERILDNATYQNLKFDLSADGKIIVVQRVNRRDPSDFGPWILREGEDPQPLKGQPGGDFLITPDSDALAIAQGQGLALLPLYPDAKPLDFLPKFGMVLSFSRDGSQAAMVKFNSDRTKSLFLVSNQGVQKELLKTDGSILSAQFDPTRQTLYCVLTDLIVGETYQETPYLGAIDLKTSKLNRLLSLPGERDVQVSLAPDGLAVLYDQAATLVPGMQVAGTHLRTAEGKTIADSRLWFLPVPTSAEPDIKPQPEPLPMAGLRPRWLP
ncbi:MAG TPA: hypothetical protein V6C64_07525 [Microcoleaceae cyanobacterium]